MDDTMTAGMVIVRLLIRPEAIPPEFCRGGTRALRQAPRSRLAGSVQMLVVFTSRSVLKLPTTAT